MKKEILAALAKAQTLIPDIGKDSTANAGAFSYNYASYPAILKAIKAPLLGCGLIIVESVCRPESTDILAVRVYHAESGEFIESEMALPNTDDPQKRGAMLTYYRRYLVCGLLNLCPEDDLDGIQAVPDTIYNEPTVDQRSAPTRPAPRKQAPSKPVSANDYVIKFGKFKNKRLATLQADDVYSYLDWLADSAQRDGKKMSKGALELGMMADAFYPAKQDDSQPTYNDPGPGDEDDIPF